MATVTAGDMVRDALGLLLVLGQQDTLAAADMDDGLRFLNSMLESWGLIRQNIFKVNTETFALTAGDQTYTIGSGGDFNTARPSKITNASYIIAANVSYPLRIIDERQWADIAYKPLTSYIPQVLWYSAGYPLGTLNMWPAPGSNMSLVLCSYAALQEFTDKDDVMVLPPGYQRAIIPNLAIELAPLYNKNIGPTLTRNASLALRAIRGVNAPRPVMSTGLPTTGGRYIIEGDQTS
jgi:hypothetical protein